MLITNMRTDRDQRSRVSVNYEAYNDYDNMTLTNLFSFDRINTSGRL